MIKQAIKKYAKEFYLKYNYLIQPLMYIIIPLSCILFTFYLVEDFIKVGDRSTSIIIGFILGFILSLAILGIWSTNIDKELQAVVLERNLLKPKDGEIYKISGILKPLGPPLISPFSRTPCISYEYEITHDKEYVDETDITVRDANGTAMTASVIQGKKHKIKICGHVRFEGFGDSSIYSDYSELDAEIFENAKQYIRKTKFNRLYGTSIIGKLKFEYKDTTGEYRFDERSDNFKDLKGRSIYERCVPLEAQVVAIGEYSSTLNGLIVDRRGGLRIIAGKMHEVQSNLDSLIFVRFKLIIILLSIYVIALGLIYIFLAR